MQTGLGLLLVSLLMAPLPTEAPPSPAEVARRDALTHYGVGLLLANDHRPASAITQFEAATKANPASTEARKPLIELYIQLGRDAAALRVARESLVHNPDDPELLQTTATIEYRLKQYRDAEALLKQATESPSLKARPGQKLDILRDWAKAAEQAKDWEALRNAAEQTIALLDEKKNHFRNNGTFPTLADWTEASGLAHEKLGDALTQLQAFPQATDAYQAAHQLFATDQPQAAARLDWNLSGLLMKQGKLNDALVHLDRTLAMQPTTLEPYQRMISLYHALDRDDQALARLLVMTRSHDKVEAVHWLYAQELMRSSPDAAGLLFQDRMRQTTDPRLYRMMARAMGQSSPSNLLALLNGLFQAVADDDSALSVKRRKGVIQQLRALTSAIKDEPSVIEPLRAATLSSPQPLNPSTTEFLAGELERAGQVEQAIALYRKSDNEDAQLELLMLLSRQRQWAALQAEAQRQIIARERGNAGGSLRPDVYLAEAFAQQGREREALAALDTLKAVQSGGQLWAQLEPLRIMSLLGDHQEAILGCDTLLKETTDADGIRQVRLVRSNAYLGLKQYLQAEAELRLILEFFPDDPLTLNNLGYNLAEQGRKLPEAELLIRRAIEIDRINRLAIGEHEPLQGTYLDSLGWVLLRRDKLNEAKLVLEKALTQYDVAANAIVWDHLGDVRFRLSDKLGAADAWLKAAERYTNTLQGREDDRRNSVIRKLEAVQK